MPTLPQPAVEKATRMLQKNPEDLRSNIEGLLEKIPVNSRISSVLSSGGDLIAYMLSSDVPLSRKSLILGGIIWIAIPDPIIGPVDDILVATFLLPFISRELDKYRSGEYAKQLLPAQEIQVARPERISSNRFFFPELL